MDYWTSRDAREVHKSHLNYVIMDTRKWEQTAAYHIDRHDAVQAFVKNAGLGFAIPYFHKGTPNADHSHGSWAYELVHDVSKIPTTLDRVAQSHLGARGQPS